MVPSHEANTVSAIGGMHMKPTVTVRPSDASANFHSAVKEGTIDLVATVPVGAFPEAWARLHKFVANSPDNQFYERCDDQLRLELGTFWALFKQLPMGPYEHLRWVQEYDSDLANGQYVRAFVAERLVAEPNVVLGEIADGDLYRLADRIAEASKARSALSLISGGEQRV
jgi:hypothetical protein